MEYFLAGIAVTKIIQNLQEKRVNTRDRVLVCNSLQQTYTPQKFTPAIYNLCLEYGAEHTIAVHYLNLQ